MVEHCNVQAGQLPLIMVEHCTIKAGQLPLITAEHCTLQAGQLLLIMANQFAGCLDNSSVSSLFLTVILPYEAIILNAVDCHYVLFYSAVCCCMSAIMFCFILLSVSACL